MSRHFLREQSDVIDELPRVRVGGQVIRDAGESRKASERAEMFMKRNEIQICDRPITVLGIGSPGEGSGPLDQNHDVPWNQ